MNRQRRFLGTFPGLLHLPLVGLLLAVGSAPAVGQTAQGVVREASSVVAIGGADVTLTNQATGAVIHVVSDDDGRFSLRIPEAGLYRLGASRIGYEAFESDPFFVPEGESITADVFLEARPVELEGLDVEAEGRVPALARAGFYRRMELGIGHFLLREEIEALHANRVTDLFRRLPGVQVVSAGSLGSQDVILRGGRNMFLKIGETPEVCYPSVSIDGQLIRAGGKQPANWNSEYDRKVGTWGQLLHPDDVEAIEVYPGAGGLPVQVAGSISPCGAILIYTRG